MSAGNPVSLLRPGISFTECGLTLPDDLNEVDYAAVGCQISRMRKRLQWLIGDWWAFGEDHEYGSRTKLVEGEEWGDGPSLQHCMNVASVCRAFETSRRREVLSFSHHSEVAGLPPQQADELLDWCEETIAETGEPRSTRELRAEIQHRSKPEPIPTPAPMIPAKISVSGGGTETVLLRSRFVYSEPGFISFPPIGEPVPPIVDPATLDLDAALDLIDEALRAAQASMLLHRALHRRIANAQTALPVLRAALHPSKDHGKAASL